jgi:hypothetical protein
MSGAERQWSAQEGWEGRVDAGRRGAIAAGLRRACPIVLHAFMVAVSASQFRALDAVARCPHGVLSLPAELLAVGEAARVAREGSRGSRARLASGTRHGLVALRGGSERYIDAQLRGEILEVISRALKHADFLCPSLIW